MKLSKKIRTMVDSVNTKDLSNTQKVLVTLLRSHEEGDGWVSRKSLRVANAASRLRELRQSSGGSFEVEVKRADELGRKGDTRTFFYRLSPASINSARVSFALHMDR